MQVHCDPELTLSEKTRKLMERLFPPALNVILYVELSTTARESCQDLDRIYDSMVCKGIICTDYLKFSDAR